MEYLLEVAYNTNQILNRPLEQGDCAHLQGFIKNFHDKREVTAFRLCILSWRLDQLIILKCVTCSEFP